ncbi:SpoIID/LytB domain-containing protein, partial [Myxococcota bacterium]|nr:SpoIID/LytB domain-containing protein [Myxococcota bacterium]
QVLAKMGTRHHGDPFHLCSRVHCQVYEGLHKVYARTTKAVKETRGMVLFDAQGLPADTVYHSSSGGHGEHNENVWGGEPKPYLRGRPDGISWHYTTDADLSGFLLKPPVSFCKAGNKGFRWVVTLAPSATATLLKKAGIPGRIKSVRVTRRGVSGRALELRLTTSKKKVTISGELNIRRLFGGLRSSLFLVSQKGQSLVFTGAGYGHGVGMSQWGAINRAKAGQSFTKILRHYYFGTKLIKLF